VDEAGGVVEVVVARVGAVGAALHPRRVLAVRDGVVARLVGRHPRHNHGRALLVAQRDVHLRMPNPSIHPSVAEKKKGEKGGMRREWPGTTAAGRESGTCCGALYPGGTRNTSASSGISTVASSFRRYELVVPASAPPPPRSTRARNRTPTRRRRRGRGPIIDTLALALLLCFLCPCFLWPPPSPPSTELATAHCRGYIYTQSHIRCNNYPLIITSSRFGFGLATVSSLCFN
jgi:hypothetical protein